MRAGWRGTGLPNPSRETKFSGADADREILIFPIPLTTSRIGIGNLILTGLIDYIHRMLHGSLFTAWVTVLRLLKLKLLLEPEPGIFWSAAAARR